MGEAEAAALLGDDGVTARAGDLTFGTAVTTGREGGLLPRLILVASLRDVFFFGGVFSDDDAPFDFCGVVAVVAPFFLFFLSIRFSPSSWMPFLEKVRVKRVRIMV